MHESRRILADATSPCERMRKAWPSPGSEVLPTGRVVGVTEPVSCWCSRTQKNLIAIVEAREAARFHK